MDCPLPGAAFFVFLYPCSPDTPTPNRAKSPFNGSFGNTSRNRSVSFMAEAMLAALDCISPRRFASCRTWVSIGIINVRLSISSLHSPRSTGEESRTIHRRNIQMRLHEDLVFLGMMPSIPLSEKNFTMASTASRHVSDLFAELSAR